MTEQQTSLVTEAAAPQRAAVSTPSKSPRWKPRLATWAPLLVLILVCIVIALINPRFLTTGNFVRIAQAAMIPLVLGLGATFVILMGSIDLSVEGVVALGAVITSLLVLHGGNDTDLGIAGLVVVVLTGAGVGLVTGVVHVRLKIPSFMTTLGTWFVAAGVANALLGGSAVRINDPLVRALVLERAL